MEAIPGKALLRKRSDPTPWDRTERKNQQRLKRRQNADRAICCRGQLNEPERAKQKARNIFLALQNSRMVRRTIDVFRAIPCWIEVAFHHHVSPFGTRENFRFSRAKMNSQPMMSMIGALLLSETTTRGLSMAIWGSGPGTIQCLVLTGGVSLVRLNE